MTDFIIWGSLNPTKKNYFAGIMTSTINFVNSREWNIQTLKNLIYEPIRFWHIVGMTMDLTLIEIYFSFGSCFMKWIIVNI